MKRRMNTLVGLLAIVVSAGTASAQEARATSINTGGIEDPNIKVVAVAIRYGKLTLLGADGRRYTLPTSTYTSERAVKSVVNDGVIAQLAGPIALLGGPAPVLGASPNTTSYHSLNASASTTIVVQALTIGSDGLLRATSSAGQSLPIPDGTYISGDGKMSLTIANGRPSQFKLPVPSQSAPINTSVAPSTHR
jgi:hypothetical protein